MKGGFEARRQAMKLVTNISLDGQNTTGGDWKQGMMGAQI